jgi:2-C-methyl-D-erythritol 4-phosphate cytidylyltransferase
MATAAVILAGGEGARMRAQLNKVFLDLEGRTIVDHSLGVFQSSSRVQEIVLVARAADLAACEPLRQRFPKLRTIVAGGDVRHRSEFAGVRALAGRIDAAAIDTVLVHDAVRPFATERLIERLLASLSGSVGCIPGLRLPITTVLADDGWLTGYPTNLWAVQTPQAFESTWLLEAHNRAARSGFVGTDTSSVVEWAGGDVRVIDGDPENIKITTPADLAVAKAIAARRRSTLGR